MANRGWQVTSFRAVVVTQVLKLKAIEDSETLISLTRIVKQVSRFAKQFA